MNYDRWTTPAPADELFVLDGHGGAPRCVAGGSTRVAFSLWLPDGRRIAFPEWIERVWETWILDVESSERSRLGSGSIRAIAADGSIALLETKSALQVVNVATEEVVVADAFLPGWYQDSGRGRAHAIIDARLAIHDGLPPRGAKQHLGFGSLWPNAYYPLRLTEWESGRSTVLVPLTYSYPFSYSAFEFAAGDS